MCRTVTFVPTLVLPIAALAILTGRLPAQSPPGMPGPGAHVRVWSPDFRQMVQGDVLAADSTSLRLERSSAQYAFPWARIDSLQVSRGRQGGSGRRGALIGALIGGGALAILAGTSVHEGDVIDPAAAAGVSLVVGALGGALVGGTIGASRGTERWESVPLRPRVGARRPAPGPARVALFRIPVG